MYRETLRTNKKIEGPLKEKTNKCSLVKLPCPVLSVITGEALLSPVIFAFCVISTLDYR